MVSEPTKNQRIKQTLQATKARRQTQCCRLYELKITKAKLMPTSCSHLEAKWFHNFILSQEDLFAVETFFKLKQVLVKVGENYEKRALRCLSSQMKQGLITRIHNAIHGLAQQKRKGRKVGRLKFKRQIGSIPLKQYVNTYRLLPEQQKIKLQWFQEHIRVRGIDQLPPDAECANAQLISRHGDYYLQVVTYQPKETQRAPPRQGIGLDFGLSQQLTFSTGIVLN